MLTYMVASKDASLFIVDEPDIYLHSDLQRQLVSGLRTLGPDILIATHSTEIILEAEVDEILTVKKNARSAKRIADPSQLREVFDLLGSNAKPVLTQVARSERIVFVEGKDFQIISHFAHKLSSDTVANRSAFAVVPAKGFNPNKVRMFKEGVEATTGTAIRVAVIFDRDYRSDSEVAAELAEMKQFTQFAHIHNRKELENFLLDPNTIKKAIEKRLIEQNRRSGKSECFSEDILQLLNGITDSLKNDILAQYLKKQTPFLKAADKSIDDTNITSYLLNSFGEKWNDMPERLKLVPGKEVLARLNTYLQDKWKISVTATTIIEAMDVRDVPEEMRGIVASLEEFATASR